MQQIQLLLTSEQEVTKSRWLLSQPPLKNPDLSCSSRTLIMAAAAASDAGDAGKKRAG